MLTDNPIDSVSKDKYDFANYAHILSDTIKDTTDLPFCIGIFGDWGTGKSSIMNMIKKILETDCSIKTIWFNPWKYDKKEDLWHALIQTILYEIIAKSNDAGFTRKVKELAKSTAWMVMQKGVSTLTSGLISQKEFNTLKESISKQDELHYKHINQFENDFEKVIDSYTNNGRLIIFIDDLDRCLPDNAITVLESLKLFIGNSKCVFVIGMDNYIVEAGIKQRFGDKINMSGRDYLDKMIQVPFFLPPVPFEKLKQSLMVEKTADYPDNIWQLLEHGLGGNPRKTKRFVNSYYLLKEVSNRSTTDDNIDINQTLTLEVRDYYLAKLLIFQLSYPDFYSALKLNPEYWVEYENVLMNNNIASIADQFQTRPELKKFWDNPYFRSFMESTVNHNNNFPIPPSENIVRNMLKAISLVEYKNSRDWLK